MNYIQQRIEKMGLRSQKIFVLPTSRGYLFFLSLSIIFCMGLVYGNNMCFLIAFLMLGQFIVTLLVSHKNVQKLNIEDIKIESTHIGKNLKTLLKLREKESLGENIIVEINKKKILFSSLKNGRNIASNPYDVRQKINTPFVTLYSTHPYGLFKTWRYFKIPQEYYLYPEILLNEKEVQNISTKSEFGLIEIDADFQEHKKFERGQSMKRIDWKKFAMKDELFIKKFSLREDEKLTILLEDLDLELEDKVKLATTLIYNAQSSGSNWELKSYNHQFESPTDFERSLKYLTLYEG